MDTKEVSLASKSCSIASSQRLKFCFDILKVQFATLKSTAIFSYYIDPMHK